MESGKIEPSTLIQNRNGEKLGQFGERRKSLFCSACCIRDDDRTAGLKERFHGLFESLLRRLQRKGRGIGGEIRDGHSLVYFLLLQCDIVAEVNRGFRL